MAENTAPAGFELDLSLQVGKYEIHKQLGKGATGTVYEAVDTFSGQKVALKVIEPEVFRDPEFGTVYRAQLLNEASLAGKLKHPHIVAILDAVVQDDAGHIAMELVTGGDLSQNATPDKLLPVADVLQIGFKCCGALNYAFAEGIVHRDIKPANIMIQQGTDVKISDFGAALLKKTQAVHTEVMGSPYYMSPEQIEEKELTHHSDMYSLGVVLYELLTGAKPFTAPNCGSRNTSGSMTFSATLSPVKVFTARYTVPVAPLPSWRSTSYLPICRLRSSSNAGALAMADSVTLRPDQALKARFNAATRSTMARCDRTALGR